MSVAYRQKFTDQNGGTSLTSRTISVPTGTVNGDQLLTAIALAQVSGQPALADSVITPPAGGTWTLLLDTTDGNQLRLLVYKRTASSEPASYTWSWSASCRVSVAMLAYSGAAAPTLAEIATQTGSATTHSTPAITVPTTGREVGFFARLAGTTGNMTSYDVTEVSIIGGAGSSNAELVVADHPVEPGSRYMEITTAASASTLIMGVVFLPDLDANVPPVANAGADRTVEASTPIVVSGSGSTDSDGTIASYTWRKISGGGSLSATNVASPTFTPSATPGVTVLGLIVTDDDGTPSTEDTVTITTVAAGQYARPIGDVSRAGWTARNTSGTVVASAYTTIDEATADSADYDESPNAPTYANEARYQLAPLTDPVDDTGHWIDAQLWVPAPASTGTARIRWYDGVTVVAEFVQAVTATPTVYRFELTGSQAANVDYSDIEIGVAFKDVA